MAGKKGVIVKTFDEGTDGRRYGHAIVAGIARAPLKVKKGMDEKKVEKRSRVKPFLKLVNFNHLMPTRYASRPTRMGIPCRFRNSSVAKVIRSQPSAPWKLFGGSFVCGWLSSRGAAQDIRQPAGCTEATERASTVPGMMMGQWLGETAGNLSSDGLG
jgi:hypothetical protein